MVLPPRAYAQIEGLLPEVAPCLRLQRLTRVYFKEGKDCARLLAQWWAAAPADCPRGVRETALVLQDPQGNYTPAYLSLVRDFYPWAS